jgi:hypothetical protein
MRTSLGDFYTSVQEASGTTPAYQRVPFPIDPEFGDMSFGYPYLSFALADVASLTYVTGNSIVPSYKVPIRVYGNVENIKNNEFWKSYIIGGTFGTSSFGGIYNEKVYRNLNFTYNTAYPAKEHNEFSELNRSHDEMPIEISAKYNYYLPQYESYLKTLNSIKMIPNAYLLAQRQFTNWAIATTDPGPSLSLPSSISSFVSLEHQTSTNTLFSPTLVSYLPPVEDLYAQSDPGSSGEYLYEDFTAKLRAYFNDRLPYANISASTMANITRLGNNIIFDDHAMSTIFQDVVQEASKLPFYININIPIVRQDDVMGTYGTTRLFADMLEQNTTNGPYGVDDVSPNFVSFFMRLLKERFADSRGGLKSIQSQNYKTRQKADLKTKKVSEIFEVENQALASLNLIPALIAGFNDTAPAYGEGEKNYILINTNEYVENMVANVNSSYRYINSQLTLLFLNKILDKVSFPNPLFLQNIGSMASGAPTTGITIDPYFLYRFYGMAETTNYNETIAYRIVKIAGEATGESNTQNIVQNIWLYNYNNDNLSIDHHNFIDTQIGYGENITYKIYAYVINVGARYKASDLILSRDIGIAEVEGAVATPDMHCVEYYNPFTGEPSPALSADISWVGSVEQGLNFISSNVGLANREIRFQADYNLHFEPVVEITEVPLFEKTISVLDNPAHSHDVVPFQKMNASQEVGFLLSPESFVPGPMPIPLTEKEQVYKKSYLESQDIIEGGNVRNPTKSPHTLVKIYRMTTKPRNLQEFALYQYREKDLTETAQGAENPKCVLYDKLKTNQKYYYLFRFFNQHGAMGYLSPIIEAELVSDGGYIYSTFEVIPIEELDDPKDINPSMSLKKILSIIPNLNQLRIDTTNVDFLEPAETQLENLKVGSPELSELLWGRDFKIRLTSTKTGKKIDLNLKFHINEET